MSPVSVVNPLPAYLRAAEELRENPEQWRAYESQGNCVVLAGPGSGKTKTLTTKIARMLHHDVRYPRGIACLTYSSECARDLGRKLEALGVGTFPNLFIGTVHSFCLKHVLLPFGRLGGIKLPDPLAVATPSQQWRLFKQAAEDVGLTGNPKSLKTAMDRFRRTALDRDDDVWHRPGNKLAQCTIAYEKRLREAGLIDFDDMTLFGLQLIEQHEWVRRAIRAKFPILVVDEYQDLGVPLHRMVLKLCLEAGIRLFAVGDPDQSIYGFAGADPSLLENLAKHEAVESVRLRFNYRSRQNLVKLSQVALGEDRGYQAKGGKGGTITFHECPGGIEDQAATICQNIIPDALQRIPGLRLGDIAVLYLDRYGGNVIAQYAAEAGYRYIRIDQGAAYPKTPLTRWIEECAAWCGGGWKRGTPRLSAILKTWLNMNNVASDDLRSKVRRDLIHFLLHNRTPAMAMNEWLTQLNEQCLTSFFLAHQEHADEKEAFDALFKACSPGGDLSDLSVGEFGQQSGSNTHLNLITLYSSKGLEYEVVIMMGMDEGRIPSWSANDEECREYRRLFYVGLTRAKREVHMTYSGWTENAYGKRFHRGPSRFLLEVKRRSED